MFQEEDGRDEVNHSSLPLGATPRGRRLGLATTRHTGDSQKDNRHTEG